MSSRFTNIILLFYKNQIVSSVIDSECLLVAIELILIKLLFTSAIGIFIYIKTLTNRDFAASLFIMHNPKGLSALEEHR